MVSNCSIFGIYAPPSLLNIVLHGNSILDGEDIPAQKIASLRPTATVINSCSGGVDILYLISNFNIQVHNYYNSNKINIVICLETLDYIDDTLGSAGNSLSLTNQAAAATENYNQMVNYANLAYSKNWLPVMCTSPDILEPNSYANATDQAKYKTARDASYDLMRSNNSWAYRFADVRARSEFSDPTNIIYYQDEGDGQHIHLTNTGYELLGTVINSVF